MVSLKYTDPPTILSETNPAESNRLEKKSLACNCYSNATICPWYKGVPDQYCGEIILEDGQIAKDVNAHRDYSLETDSIKVCADFENTEIIYLGSLSLCWGHYFTDGISKLWFFETEEGKSLLERNVPVCITSCYQNVQTPPTAYINLLRKLGYNFKVSVIQNITKYSTIYSPQPSLFIKNKSRRYTIEQSLCINRLISSVDFSNAKRLGWGKYEKVYFSRAKLKNKHAEYGESQLEKAFKKAGYEIIYPERHSFDEQVYILQNAKSFATTEGSIAHNAVFCRPGTEVIIIRKAFYTNDHQYVINQISGIDVTYIDAHLSVLTNGQPNLGPFFLYINDNVIRFFKDRYGITLKNTFNTIRFRSYVMKCLRYSDLSDRFSSGVPKWYFDKVPQELANDVGIVRWLYQWLKKTHV